MLSLLINNYFAYNYTSIVKKFNNGWFKFFSIIQINILVLTNVNKLKLVLFEYFIQLKSKTSTYVIK